MIPKLIKDRFGKEELNEEEIDFLVDVSQMHDKMPKRHKSTLIFKNNLKIPNDESFSAKLKYIKIGHVIEGLDVYVYERMNLEPITVFEDYFIGGALAEKDAVSAVTEIKDALSKKVTNAEGKRDNNNYYDRLYVQFVIEKTHIVNGQPISIDYLYNQSYKQFLERELYDLFATDKFVTSLENLNIQLTFQTGHDTIKNNHKSDDLKLILSVSVPTGYEIDAEYVELENR